MSLRRLWFWLLPLFGMVAFGLWSGSAQAAFVFCNETRSVVEAALGAREGAEWISEGWWQIQPGQCARVYNKPLTQRFYFYHARALTLRAKNGTQPLVWSGKYAFCTDSKAFRITGDSGCAGRGYREQGFQEIDVGPGQKNYTLTFRDDGSR